MKWPALTVLLAIGSVSARLSELTSSTTSFTFDFFKRAYDPTKNAVFSPISIHSALSMVYPVAGERASLAMQRNLYLPTDKKRATSNLGQFLLELNRTVSGKSAAVLRMLTKVYHDQEDDLRPQVQTLFRDVFGVEFEEADFNDPAKLVSSVNSWVDQATMGMVADFMQPDEVHADSVLMLVNAVAFQASWQIPFDARKTKPKTFHFLDGERPVDMMLEENGYVSAYLSEYNCRVIDLPYRYPLDVSMVIVLPLENSSLEEVIRRMNVTFYEKISEELGEMDERVRLSMPKFTMRKKTDAKAVLKQMGLDVLFEEPDLNLFEGDGSRITDATQTAFIKVDEKGTDAAAVTAFQYDRISGPRIFTVDRPFLYLIRKHSTEDIIFIGHYSVYEPPQP